MPNEWECGKCGRQLNRAAHQFQGVRLCEDCLVLVHGTYRGLRGYLHRLERAGMDIIKQSLLEGDSITTEELVRRLRDGV